MWSQICENNYLCFHKTTFRKKVQKKNKKTKKTKHESVYNLWRILGTKLVFFVDLLDHIYKTVFPKQFFVCFSTVN